MAVLLSSDWNYPRADSEMDLSSSNSSRQRSSPANDHPSSAQVAPSHHHHLQQQVQQHQLQQSPYTFPLQQQPQGSWTPSIAAAPFYPSFQGQQQQQSPQPYPNQLPPQAAAYFDPANAQLAQWAYQQMMFNAQYGFPQMAAAAAAAAQRTASNSSASNDYFVQNPLAATFNPFPSGTPPPHAQRGGGGSGGSGVGSDHQQQAPQNGQYTGFHPYRRPNRQGTHTQDNNNNNDWRTGIGHIPQPPYARPEASGSTSSINSSSSQRQRTNSNQSGHSGHNVPSANSISRSRNNGSPKPSASTPSSTRNSPSPGSSSASSSKASTSRVPHNRNGSSSSTSTTTSSRPSMMLSQSSPTTATSPTSTSAVAPITPRVARPSPLSQGTFTASEKRMSRDDSDLAAMLESSKPSSSSRSGGLKGRLRRALSFNALKEEEVDDDESIKASAYNSGKANGKEPLTINSSMLHSEATIQSPDSGLDDRESTATVQTKKKGRALSLFNSRINASTDNISLSSTVSSASVMIRKLGSMSKLVVRRNSLAGITSIFKDKNKDSDKTKKKDKKAAKAEVIEASVSHVTAEIDRGSDWSVGSDMNGLSPAATLARQHTLKSNAEAAARAKAQQEAQAVSNVAGTDANGQPQAGVPTWDKNTATRAGSASPVKRSGDMRVNEDGTRVIVEDDDDDESDDGGYDPHQGPYNADGWDDDDDWDVPDNDEDVTIRMGMGRTSITDDDQDEVEPWAVDARRSVERTQRPMKGILKNAGSYDQSRYLGDQSIPTRGRSNSYNSHTGQAELGPLARIPSPDPDHIDGLHRHNSHSSSHGNNTSIAPSIPPLQFDSSSPISSTFHSRDLSDTHSHSSHHSERPSSIFQHPSLNSSAPALSMIPSSAPTLSHRSATAPAKKLAFASSLSVYDTFSSSVYDRRSEPATWSRLTPALAQRIKEELNSYKMEEMEVHAASRIHTQFFV